MIIKWLAEGSPTPEPDSIVHAIAGQPLCLLLVGLTILGALAIALLRSGGNGDGGDSNGGTSWN